MGFRLLVDKRKGAALNLLSETLNSFDTESAGRAAVLASFASVAVNAIAHGEDAASLRRGLLSNREIGKAVGMLMLLNGFTEEEAFDLLRHHSQSLNIKLADVARTVIENRGQLPPPPPRSEATGSLRKPRRDDAQTRPNSRPKLGRTHCDRTQPQHD